MNTFVVRVYRCEAQRDGGMVGRLEHIESGEQYTFHEVTELVSTLLAHASRVEIENDDEQGR